MGPLTRFLAITALLLLPTDVLADHVELRRDATMYAEATRASEPLGRLRLKEGGQPYTLRLVSTTSSNGYYHVRLPGTLTEGWIYRTYVRRFSGFHPAFVPYSRQLYRHWIDEDRDCQDTRAEVLIRDATGTVAYTNDRQCHVVQGRWLDPYTGETYREAKQLQVDHFVPLKNAHDSGGWAWSAERRRQYQLHG
jgi:hypothetical protein